MESPEFFLEHSRVRDLFHGYLYGDLATIKLLMEPYSGHPEYPHVMKKLYSAMDGRMSELGFVPAKRDLEAESSLGSNGQKTYLNKQVLRRWLGKA